MSQFGMTSSIEGHKEGELYARQLEGLEVLAALDRAPGSLAEARSVLRDYGNMSAVTVLFVLERTCRASMAAYWKERDPNIGMATP